MTRTYDWHGHTHEIGLPNLTDKAMASTIRMLSRSDPDHEMIVCAARDRIMCLAKENTALANRIKVLEAERAEVLEDLKIVLLERKVNCYCDERIGTCEACKADYRSRAIIAKMEGPQV